MKLRSLFILFVTALSTLLPAQQLSQSKVTISWEGIQQWQAGESTMNVLSFSGALYPFEDKLPYYHTRIAASSNLNYIVQLQDIRYIKLTSKEQSLAKLGLISTQPQIIQQFVTQSGKTFLDISILPFATQGSDMLRAQSFELQIQSAPKMQKAVTNTQSLHSYADNSLLKQGRFVKIKVANSGIFKLTYENLVAMGIDPANAHVFGFGGAMLEQSFSVSKLDDLPEVKTYTYKGADNVFNAGDYILFYAQGPVKWQYSASKNMFIHTVNPYSNYGYYFVSSDAGTDKQIAEETTIVPDGVEVYPVTNFTDYAVHEVEAHNLAETGRVFYGEQFNSTQSEDFTFSTPNAYSIKLRADVAATSTVASSFNLLLNGGQSKTMYLSARTPDNFTAAMGANYSFNYSSASDTQTFTLTYNMPNSTSVGYLNYLEANFNRNLTLTTNPMQFQNIDYIGNGSYNEYQLTNAGSNIQVWDITDTQNIFKVPTTLNADTIRFIATGDEVRNYLAIDPSAANAFPSPEVVGVVANQNLHAIQQADFVIITPSEFLSQANEIAQLHRDKDQMTCEVFTTDQIYNEFSSGTPDATAYRWAMKMLYDRALTSGDSNNLPKYLMLFGTGTYDNRKIISNSGSNLILTYQAENSLVTTSSYVTDDYFGLLDDTEGANVPSGLLDLGIGRLPVSTTTQANDVVAKIKNYANNAGKGSWKNQLCFLADDGGNGDKIIHMTQSDSVAISVKKIDPSYQINKIYLDAFKQETTASGESYPLAKTKFMNLIQKGLLLMNYTGHASANGWTNEGILTKSDIKGLSNSKLPLFYGATCDFLEYDCGTPSAGEYILTNPSGGGIGIISAARPVYANQNLTLNKNFCEELFKMNNGQMPRIGDALKNAKNNIGTEINKLVYVYMGDPALRLDYPNDCKVETTQFNNNSTLGNDTLKALSLVQIKGIVTDNNGNKLTNFNGTVNTVVYDKVQKVTTLDNHGEGAFTYSDRPNMLFSGSNQVKEGEFTVSFIVPKDIRYNYGEGRIAYYVTDNTMEGQGSYEKFLIGGTNDSYTAETDGPEANIYLNSTNFVSGSKVNESPVFLANVNDVHGINMAGSGIGHDISICIDNDPELTYILNNYYTAIQDSYTQGSIQFQIPELTEGKHNLKFKVWDLLNNSSAREIDFQVIKGLAPSVYALYVYPNPVKTSAKAYIVIEHDRPESIINTTVNIFDVSGRKVWSFQQNSVGKIEWDLSSQTGTTVGKGVYLCRVSVKTSDSDTTTKTAKIIVTE